MLDDDQWKYLQFRDFAVECRKIGAGRNENKACDEGADSMTGGLPATARAGLNSGSSDASTREFLHIQLKGLRVAADIGVLGHEIGRRQALIITILVETAVPADDLISEAVDYNRLSEIAHALAEERICLIETFARRLAYSCVALRGVRSADIQIEKPAALTNGLAGVRFILSR